MFKKIKALLRSPNSAKKQHTNNPNFRSKTEHPTQDMPTDPENKVMLERHDVPGTGFQICGNEELGYFVSIGHYRLTEPKPTKAICLELINTRDWELLVAMMGITAKLEIDMALTSKQK